jgi:hypothetical protein
MESILIRPESAEQIKTVKAFPKALKVPFEPQSTGFPPHVLKNIEEGIWQYENGQTISLDVFKAKHFTKA